MYSFQGFDPNDPLGHKRRYEEMYSPQSVAGGMQGMAQPAGLQIPQGGGVATGLEYAPAASAPNPSYMGGGVGLQMPSPADAAARPDGMGLKMPSEAGGGAMGGSTAGGLMAAGSALSKMAGDGGGGTPPAPQISMRTPQAQDMQFQYLFPLVEALQQLNKGRKRKA